jgi:hypothetical protein
MKVEKLDQFFEGMFSVFLISSITNWFFNLWREYHNNLCFDNEPWCVLAAQSELIM